MSYWDLSTPKTTWQALRKARKSYEVAEQVKEAAHKWGAASSSSSGKKEDNNNKPPCNNSNNNYKEANKSIPQELVFKRLKHWKCTRCGKDSHNALYCVGDAVTSSNAL